MSLRVSPTAYDRNVNFFSNIFSVKKKFGLDQSICLNIVEMSSDLIIIRYLESLCFAIMASIFDFIFKSKIFFKQKTRVG